MIGQKVWYSRSVLLVLIAAGGCAPTPAASAISRTGSVVYRPAGVSAGREVPRPGNGRELIEMLRRVGSGCYTIEPRPDWVVRDDLPYLSALIDSDVPCASVLSPLSSNYPARSTVGKEARFLLWGYAVRCYPPSIHAQNWDLPGREATLKWLLNGAKPAH